MVTLVAVVLIGIAIVAVATRKSGKTGSKKFYVGLHETPQGIYAIRAFKLSPEK
jgi:hypothetical protein